MTIVYDNDGDAHDGDWAQFKMKFLSINSDQSSIPLKNIGKSPRQKKRAQLAELWYDVARFESNATISQLHVELRMLKTNETQSEQMKRWTTIRKKETYNI